MTEAVKALLVFDGGDAPGYMAIATALTEEWTRRGVEVYVAREGFRSLCGDSLYDGTPLVRLVWSEEEVLELRGRRVSAVALHRRIADPGCEFRSERFRGICPWPPESEPRTAPGAPGPVRK